MLHDLIIVVLTWILSGQLVVLGWPFILSTPLRHLPDRGYAFARTVGWLLVALPIWFLAYLGLPINSMLGAYLVFMFLLVIGVGLGKKQGSEWRELIRSAKHLILIEEGLFLFGLMYQSITRGFMPDINGLEKFMDAGLINTYLNTTTFPIPDMWLTGFSFNYYTFGHYLGSVALRFFHQDLAIGYNLLLAFLMGLMLTQAFGLIIALVRPIKSGFLTITSGLLAAFLVVFGGNTQTAWYLLTHHSFVGYWYPDATRFIENTIHEFPSYSFIVSDLHAHVWSMVLVLPTLIIIWQWASLLYQAKNLTQVGNWSDKFPLWAVIIGVMLGVLGSTSTWDLLIYGTFLAILGGLLLISSRGKLIWSLLISAGLVGVATLLTISPWWLNFESISEGVRWVVTRSELWRFMALWTGHITVSAIALGWALRLWLRQMKNTAYITPLFIIAVVIAAWGLLLLPELIYFKDIYPSHPRANTMFKLTFQAFILMGLSGSWVMGKLADSRRLPSWRKSLLLLPILIFVVAVGIYPYFGFRDYYNGWREYKGLDGLTWLKKENPSDYQAIMWLKQTAYPNQVIVEAVGESYTTFARVSSFTQLNTILGWRVHEWLWRGSFDIAGARTPEVQNIYENPSSPEAKQKLAEYKVSYIFIGDKEYEAYPNLDLVGIKQLGRVVFEQGRTVIVQLSGYN